MPRRRNGRAFVGRLASGPNPLWVPGRRVGRAFLGQLASGPNPFGAFGLGRLARGAGPGPKVPTITYGGVPIWRVDRASLVVVDSEGSFYFLTSGNLQLVSGKDTIL